MEIKKWYQSKIVWLGVIQTLIAILGLVTDLLNKSEVVPADFTILASSILLIVIRVWFTDTKIES